MKKLVFMTACLSGAAIGQVPADPKPSNLTYRLEYAKRDADAHHDCPCRRGNRYAADFKKRYGERIDRLKSVHLATSGPDPDFVVVTDCRRFIGSAAERDARHRQAMDDFEQTLRLLEREFGNY